MKKIELESLFKSFLLFFFSQAILLGGLFFMDYKKEVLSFENELFNKMRVCSFDLQCKNLSIDFVAKGDYELYKIYKEKKDISAYFSIPNSQKNSLKVFISKEQYEIKIAEIQKEKSLYFLGVLAVVALLSLIFSLYALSPFRNALRVTEEFIKDILHDFNTPLSTLRLNVSMLKEELGENSKLRRIENSVQTVLNLQENLRSYLSNHASQKEKFDLKELLIERVNFLENTYKEINFRVNIEGVELFTNKDALRRVIDNLLSNAAKYNKKDGSVEVSMENKILTIKDSGKGIKNPKRVFERFYKEQDRGIGIGLHIVKKLCEELGIQVSLESEVGKGTSFFLNLKSLTLH